MSATVVILELAGNIILLLWGMRMVQSGVERAFGSDLRRVLGRALRNRLVAVIAGTGVTTLLQSSTATAMMLSLWACGFHGCVLSVFDCVAPFTVSICRSGHTEAD